MPTTSFAQCNMNVIFVSSARNKVSSSLQQNKIKM